MFSDRGEVFVKGLKFDLENLKKIDLLCVFFFAWSGSWTKAQNIESQKWLYSALWLL